MVAYTWMLAPSQISGFNTVGTFIANRIVVASTVMVSLFVGHFATNLVLYQSTILSRKYNTGHKVNSTWKLISLFVALSNCCMRRSEKWMSSYKLLKSSLVTCPTVLKITWNLARAREAYHLKNKKI
jgi:hypothetical protein